MEKRYSCYSSVVILMLVAFLTGSRANADETVPSVQQLETQFQAQLNTRQETYGQPKATSYYDDLVDHYEQDQLMRDVIDRGI